MSHWIEATIGRRLQGAFEVNGSAVIRYTVALSVVSFNELVKGSAIRFESRFGRLYLVPVRVCRHLDETQVPIQYLVE